MTWLARLRNVFRAERVSDEIDREVAFHLAQRAEELVAAGFTPDAARQEARRRFGNPGHHKERTRDRDLFVSLETLIADLRYAVRGLRGAPGFALVAILSLALGIGANTAIFTALNAVILRPLPVPDADELVYVTSGRSETLSYPLYERFRDQVQSFAGFGAVERGMARHELSVRGAVATDVVRAPAVTGSFFGVLGVTAALGRVLGPEDDRVDADPALVISHALWQRHFGADSSIIGTVVRLDSMPATIVGVMPPGFVGFDAGAVADLWWPIQLAPRLDAFDRSWAARLTSNGVTWLVLFGRLRDGVPRDQAQAEAAVVFRQFGEQVASDPTWTPLDRQRIRSETVELEPGRAGYVQVRRVFKQPLFVLMSVVGLVLLIACANVAGLLLARGAARQREFAVRAALGGGRGRIIRQLLTESVVLSLGGGLAGFLVARWATAFLGAYLPKDDITLALEPDLRVLLFTGVVSLLTGVLFGLVPALRLSRRDLVTTIRDQGRGPAGDLRPRLQSALVVVQIALSMVLLAPAVLFVRTLQNLRSIELGFQRENLVALSLDVGRRRPSARELSDVEHRLLAAMAARPGVRSATVSGAGLLSGNGYSTEFSVDGYVAAPDEGMRAYAVLAGPRFFETMRVPLLRGREFNSGDEPPFRADGRQGRAAVVIVGESLARKVFGETDPIGRQITSLNDSLRLTIVGVAGDTKYREDPRDGTPLEMYLPYFGAGVRMPSLVYLRIDGPLSAVATDLRRVVAEVDSRVTVRRLATMDELLDQVLVRERLIAQIAGFFSAFALLLASLGLYGVVSYGATRRTREFGMRVALGATVRDVLGLVLRQGLVLALAGGTIGLAGALAVMTVLGPLLYGVSSTDPLNLAAVMSLLLAVSLFACWLPARRAARVDPTRSLRAE
ncbi:MAG: ADOP family duplicated permease [Gemmatimonadaceae bacterium]